VTFSWTGLANAGIVPPFHEHDEERNRDTTKVNFSSGSHVPILGIIGQKDAAHAIISPRNSVRYGMTGGAQRRGSQIFRNRPHQHKIHPLAARLFGPLLTRLAAQVL